MTTCTNTTHRSLDRSTASLPSSPNRQHPKKLQSLKVGVLLLHHVKATFSYNRRRAGLWLVLVWEMRRVRRPCENGRYASQCWQHWHRLHSKMAFCTTKMLTFNAFSPRTQHFVSTWVNQSQLHSLRSQFNQIGWNLSHREENGEGRGTSDSGWNMKMIITDANRCTIASLSHWKWGYCSKSNSHLMMSITVVITDCIQWSLSYCMCTSNWNSKHSQYITQSYSPEANSQRTRSSPQVICGTLLFEPWLQWI